MEVLIGIDVQFQRNTYNSIIPFLPEILFYTSFLPIYFSYILDFIIENS